MDTMKSAFRMKRGGLVGGLCALVLVMACDSKKSPGPDAALTGGAMSSGGNAGAGGGGSSDGAGAATGGVRAGDAGANTGGTFLGSGGAGPGTGGARVDAATMGGTPGDSGTGVADAKIASGGSVGGSGGSSTGTGGAPLDASGTGGAAGVSDAGRADISIGSGGIGAGGATMGTGGTGSGGMTSGTGGTTGSGGTSTGAIDATMGTGGNPGTGGSITAFTLKVLAAGLLDGTSTDWEQARDVAIDDQGFIYVVGGTSSPDFPTTPGAYDTTYNTGGSELGGRGQSDGFVTKLDPTGAIVWSTYLGSPNYDRVYAVEVDAAHNVYVAGRAGRGFPTTAGVLQPAFAGDSNPSSSYGYQDGFVAKLSADGATLIWSTYFGEAGQGFVRDIDIDGMNRVHVAMSSASGSDMALKVTSGAAQPTLRGVCDSFYARLAADGSKVEYGTFLGGNDSGCYSSNPAVRVLDDGTAFFLAGEPGAGAPTTPGAYQPALNGGDDFLLARFDPAGTMAFCTYLGGSGVESLDTHSLAIGSDGNPIIAAASASTDYPVTDTSKHASGRDVVVSILSADGKSLLRSTQIGGSGPDGAEGVSVDSAGNIYVSGFTNSADLPVTPGALRATHASGLEGLMLVLPPNLSAPLYLSYDGITAEYGNRSSMVTPAGMWAIVGAVWNVNPFPATGSNDKKIDGLHGAFFQILGR